MHFFVLTVIVVHAFCTRFPPWLKAAAAPRRIFLLGFPTYRGSTRANKSSLLCSLLQERDRKRQKVIGALGLCSSPLTEAEQAVTSYCTI